MIDIRDQNIFGWEVAIHGMRNSWASWKKSDTTYKEDGSIDILGEKDHNLMMKLVKAGSSHAKFRRMILVTCDITAPLYWWKEFDTYKIGTVANSASTMHTITSSPFDISNFSHEHLEAPAKAELYFLIDIFNAFRDKYMNSNDKKYWWQIIQLLPSSYNQTRTLLLNYEVLSNMYKDRKDHKLNEWRDFCSWIKKSLPYSFLITGEEYDENSLS